METYMQMLGRLAKNASRDAAKLGTKAKNRGLLAVANELVEERKLILQENAKDIEAAKAKGVKQSLIDRLALTEQRIEDMAEGLRQIAALDDPIGEVLGMKTRPNGLRIGKKRVPLGVVGIIYESRPNVTADAFGLCFKTGNAVILRGGSDAIHSNQAITRAIADQAKTIRVPVHMVETINKVVRARRTLTQELGREPSNKEIAEMLGEDEDRVTEIMSFSQDPVSMEAPVGDEDDSHLGDFVQDSNALSPEENAIAEMRNKQISLAMKDLTDREQEVITLRFGLDGNQPHTLEEVGQMFHVTRERIRQIEAKALRKLGAPSRKRMLRDFL